MGLSYRKLSKGNLKKILILKISGCLVGKHRIVFKKVDFIVQNFLGRTLLIYKGCFYRKLCITKFLLNYRFGEFAYTRKPFKYLLKSKN